MYSSTKCRPQLAILCFIIVVVKPKGVNNMDLEKIGKFITEQRTNKKLTQKELANRLNVTNKAVSKWENGRSMPDVGLFENLCSELDITLKGMTLL